MHYIAFHFQTNSPDQSEQLVALLSDVGFSGFEETGDQLKAFIKENDFIETSFNAIVNMFPLLQYTKTIVENINWNQQWEESFEPVLVDDLVAVRASFHPAATNVQYEIIITPKMSFGTGHHATTHLMIQQMLALDFKNKTVLDFGTGTGILAILAEKLGASKVLAIDNDEWSIANARENIAQNGCSKIIIEQRDNLPTAEKFDILLANINLNVITANLLPLREIVNPSGAAILLSGFLKENEGALLAAAKNAGFQPHSTLQKGNWIAMKIIV